MNFIAPRVPGYDVASLLGSGASSDVWLARHIATGESVALKRLRNSTPFGEQRATRESSVLAGFSHPHVVALREIVRTDDELVLVLTHAAGGSLASLLARRVLTPGEVVTVGVPLAQALAALHQRGVVHGDVSPDNVLFTARGIPLLADVGVAGVVGEGPSPWVQTTEAYADPSLLRGATLAPAHDVYALGALCRHALGGAAHGRLGEVLGTAMSPNIDSRPTPLELASLLWNACAAQPVALRAAGANGRPLWDTGLVLGDDESKTAMSPRRTQVPLARLNRRRSRRPAWPSRTPGQPAPAARARGEQRRARKAWWLAGAVGSVATGLAVLAGAAWASSDTPHRPAQQAPRAVVQPASASSAGSPSARPRPATPRPASPRPATPPPATGAPGNSSTSAAVDWRDVITGLDARRASALVDADEAMLRSVYAPGAPAFRRDAGVFTAQRRAGVRVAGVRTDVHSVTVASRSSTAVVLRVVDTMASYTTVAGDGTVSRVPSRGRRTWRVTLRAVGARWAYWDVAQATRVATPSP